MTIESPAQAAQSIISSQEGQKTEGAAPAPVEQPNQDGSEWSRRFAELTKRERMIMERQNEQKTLKNEFEALKKRLDEEYEPEIKKYRTLKDKVKAGDYGDILDEFEIPFDDLSQYYLNGAKPTKDPEVLALRKELDDFRRMNDEKEREKIDAEKQQKISHYQEYLANYAKENENDYEFINSDLTESIPVVYALMESYHKDHGRILSEKEALDLVEEHLEKKYDKLLSLKKFEEKIKARTAPSEPKSPFSTEHKPESPLNTSQTNLAPRTLPERPRILDREESIRQAASLIRWT